MKLFIEQIYSLFGSNKGSQNKKKKQKIFFIGFVFPHENETKKREQLLS